jgi:hypothetical protein
MIESPVFVSYTEAHAGLSNLATSGVSDILAAAALTK